MSSPHVIELIGAFLGARAPCLQDFVLKPLILALILAVMSSLVLRCRPKLRRCGLEMSMAFHPWPHGSPEGRKVIIFIDDEGV